MNFSNFFPFIKQFLVPVGNFFDFSWWFWVFCFLVWLVAEIWLFWRQEIFRQSIEWTTLELKIPREIRKSPRAMEQVLHALNALRNEPTTWVDKWWDGEVPRWFSLEVASFGGEVHFYVRCYAKQRNLVEAAFLSYYPDVEVEEVDDYTERFPADTKEMHAQGYDMWGAEMALRREGAYPIRTYLDFEAVDETKEYDPISSLLEVLAKVKKEEIVAMQILITPLGYNWADKWAGLVDSLKNPAKAKMKPGKPKTNVSFPGPGNVGPLPHLEVSPADKMKENMDFSGLMRTPGETNVLKAVENNLSKPAFLTQIRFIYFSPKSIYVDRFPRRGLYGAFTQYANYSLNSLAVNYAVSPLLSVWFWPFFFVGRRRERRKWRLLEGYKSREMKAENMWGEILTWTGSSKSFEMNTEGLATLFHPPTYIVLTAPHVVRVPSRKMGPPAGTAIFGGEEDVEKFK